MGIYLYQSMKRSAPIVLALVLSTLFIQTAHAARIYLSPSEGQLQVGGTLPIDVRLDNEGECVNAAEVYLRYPLETLVPADVSRGNSIFTLWVSPPEAKEDYGVVSFVGGIPGGYCGRIPGDPGRSNILATVIFKMNSSTPPGAATNASVGFLPETKILLNDGLGTEAKLSVEGATLTVGGNTTGTDKWAASLAADKTPPENFAVSLYKDSGLFAGNYFIVFSTVDKQTGLDHYEVWESDKRGRDPISGSPAVWHRINSPYQLRDQKLSAIVKVKAIDKAGNERLSQLTNSLATQPEPPQRASLMWLLALSSVAVLLTLARFLIIW
jgi:hypothetical protein